jgi:hypothetical protein
MYCLFSWFIIDYVILTSCRDGLRQGRHLHLQAPERLISWAVRHLLHPLPRYMQSGGQQQRWRRLLRLPPSLLLLYQLLGRPEVDPIPARPPIHVIVIKK